MDIGKSLRQIRIDNKKTQQQAAEVLKISRTAYNRYENNKRLITVHQLIILADYYNVSLDFLCGRDF